MAAAASMGRAAALAWLGLASCLLVSLVAGQNFVTIGDFGADTTQELQVRRG